MTTAYENQNLPKVILVGDPRLGEIFSNCGAQWIIQPVQPTVSSMWDAIENGVLDSEASIAIFTEGTSSTPDELEATLLSFAPYSDTFLIASETRGQQILKRAQELVPTVEGADPSKPIWQLPINNVQQALHIMQQVLAGKVAWNTPAVAPMPPRPAVPQPQIQQPPQPMQPVVPTPPPVPQPQPVYTQPIPAPQGQTYNPQTTATTPDPAQLRNYEQGRIYAEHVMQQASTTTPKPANALPGQMTIACMSSKGGSGKSTTALCLAGIIAKTAAAAGQPKSVVLVDLDTRDGQVGSLIGKYMPTSINIRVMPRWDANAVRQNLVHDSKLGIDALLAPVRPRNADDVGPEFYKEIIGVLQTTHDVVIMDCSVNYLDPLLGTAFSMADEILFVTTLATTSVQGMARSLTELFADPSDGGLGIPRHKVGIVANQVVRNVGMGKDKLLRAALGAPLVGQIPSDQDAVLLATNQTKMGSLLQHPTLGPAYYKLARECLPGWNLAPITTEMATVLNNDNAQQAPSATAETEQRPQKKKGLFSR